MLAAGRNDKCKAFAVVQSEQESFDLAESINRSYPISKACPALRAHNSSARFFARSASPKRVIIPEKNDAGKL
jgi:hypothetical protein